MSAAMVFLVLFTVAWLAVAVSTIVRLACPRWKRRDIALLARAGLLIWFTGMIAAMFAEVRHWPAGQIAYMQDLGVKGKLTGFVILLVGLAVRRRPRRAAATATGPPVDPGPDHA